MNRIKSITERKTQRATLNDIKRILQGLYEYEQLRIALQCTESLLRKDHVSSEDLTQWLVVLRESLKMMVTDKSLNIPTVRFLSTLSNLVKTIRDYFEHPEDYVLRLDYSAAGKKKKQIQNLEADVFSELKIMGQEITRLLEIRLRKIQQILRPHSSIDPQSVLVALAFRDTQQDERLSDVRKLASDQYPKIIEFADRVIDKKSLKREVDSNLDLLLRSVLLDLHQTNERIGTAFFQSIYLSPVCF